ncbi:MAG: PEP-CTERM sorting domain-containing protein [Phycisphaerae bacterium]|nr:PEP-CTERM sorting domain-containing protein [Phycisphaerae bacterium]
MKRTLIVAAVAAVVFAGPAMAGEVYANGSGINLVSLRDNVASANGNPGGGQVLYQTVNWDARFAPRFGEDDAPGWWQVEFQNTYNVEHYEFFTIASQYTSLTYRVEACVFDGSEWVWVDQTGPIAMTNGDNDWINPWLTGSFAPGGVDAKGVRLTILDHQGYSEICLGLANITGTNTLPVTPNLSLAQSAWNNTSVTVNGQSYPNLIDNFDGRSNHNAWLSYAGGPIEMIVTLDDLYSVGSVAMSVNGYTHTWATEVQVFISPDLSGNEWIEATGILTPNWHSHGYFQIDFVDESGSPLTFDAQRVRFDVSGGGSDSQIMIEQLYVYGAPVPEPATMTLLALGGLALLRRKR